MRWLGNLVVALLFVLVLAFCTLAVMDNDEAVALRLLSWQTPAISVYWWLVLALSLGLIFGWLFAMRGNLRLRLQTRQLRRELEQQRQELARSRGSASSES